MHLQDSHGPHEIVYVPDRLQFLERGLSAEPDKPDVLLSR